MVQNYSLGRTVYLWMVVEHLSLGGCEEMGSMALYTLLAVFPSNKVWLDDFSEINF